LPLTTIKSRRLLLTAHPQPSTSPRLRPTKIIPDPICVGAIFPPATHTQWQQNGGTTPARPCPCHPTHSTQLLTFANRLYRPIQAARHRDPRYRPSSEPARRTVPGNLQRQDVPRHWLQCRLSLEPTRLVGHLQPTITRPPGLLLIARSFRLSCSLRHWRRHRPQASCPGRQARSTARFASSPAKRTCNFRARHRRRLLPPLGRSLPRLPRRTQAWPCRPSTPVATGPVPLRRLGCVG
jgi:hypothetical protein